MAEFAQDNGVTPPVRFDPGRYDAWYASPLGRYCHTLEGAALLRALRPSPGETVLEVGAGTGRFAAVAVEGGARVFASDADPGMALWAASRDDVRRQVRWLAADGRHLPFAEGAFGAVFAVTALCFAPDHERIMAELVRVTRPGGRVVLGELNALAPWQVWRKLKAVAPSSPYRHAHFQTVAGLRRLLRRHGLQSIEQEVFLHWMPWGSPRMLRWAPVAERWGSLLAPGMGSVVMMSGTRP